MSFGRCVEWKLVDDGKTDGTDEMRAYPMPTNRENSYEIARLELTARMTMESDCEGYPGAAAAGCDG